MKEEIWKDIPGFKLLYQASSFGQIRTHIGKVTYTQKHGVRKWQQRILKQKKSKDKCHRVSLWKDGKESTLLVHRLVAMAFIPNPDNLATINHKDGDRDNNNISNLEWMSLEDNIKHGFETGLYGTNKKTRLTNKQNGEVIDFLSMSKASLYLGHNVGYISGELKKGKNESLNYKWELIKEEQNEK